MFFAVGPDRVYGKGDVSIGPEPARRAAQAVSNAQLYAAEQTARQAAEASADRMNRLEHVTGALVEASSRAAVVELIVREGGAALGAVAASVVSVRDDRLELVADEGYGKAAEPFRSIPADSPLPLAVAVRAGRPIWSPDLKSSDLDDPQTLGVPKTSSNTSACAIPLIAAGQTYAAVCLSFPDTPPFFSH